MAKKKEEEVMNDFSFFKKEIKTLDRYVDAGVSEEDYGCFDSGSYALNALLSGDIYEGFNRNKLVMTAGEKGSGKSFIGKYHFGKQLIDEGYFLFYYDSENETSESKLEEEFGYPREQFSLIRVGTVEDLTESVDSVLRGLEADKGNSFKNKRKCAIIVDSQGQLTTRKTMSDVAAQKDKADLTAPKLLKRFYKLVTVRLGRLGIPMYITNHIYIDPGEMFGDPKKVAGGEGAKYSCSTILAMSKTYEKEDGAKEVKGVVLKAGLIKSRTCREKWSVPIYLDYTTGINRYYGLHTFAVDAGLLVEYKKTEFPDIEPPKMNGRTYTGKSWVIKDPTKDPSQWLAVPQKLIHSKNAIGTILDPINEYVKSHYKLNHPVAFTYNEDDIPDDLDIDDEEVAKSEQAIHESVQADIEKQRKLNEISN